MASEDFFSPPPNVPPPVRARRQWPSVMALSAGTGVGSAVAAIGALFGYSQFVEYFFRPRARSSDVLGLEYLFIHPVVVVLVLPALSLFAVRRAGIRLRWLPALGFWLMNVAVSVGVQFLALIVIWS